MQPQTSNEVFYKRAVTALGIGTLFFLLFLLLISGAVAALTFFLAVLPFPSVIAKLIYQLTYGALYLAAFLCPAHGGFRGRRCAPIAVCRAICP